MALVKSLVQLLHGVLLSLLLRYPYFMPFIPPMLWG